MSAHANRNLLFGVLALQLEFIDREAVLRALNAWALCMERPLGDLLVEQQALDAPRCQLLDKEAKLSSIDGPHGVAFSPDGKLLAEAPGRDDKFAFKQPELAGVRLWDPETGLYLRTLPLSGWVCSVAISGDGKLLAAGSSAFDPHPAEFKIWELATGKELFAARNLRGGVWELAVSPDGKWLAGALGDYRNFKKPGEVRIWSFETGKEIMHLRGHSFCVWSVAFSPDGKRLASAAGPWQGKEAGEVKVWDLTNKQELYTVPLKESRFSGVAFSPCGRRLAVAGRSILPPRAGQGEMMILDGTPLAQTPAFEPLKDETPR